MKKIRLVLIEDNRLLREGLAAMLAEQPDISVVASSGNAEAAVKIRKQKPNLVLLDMGLRGQNSLRVVKLVTRNIPAAKIVVMDLAPIQTKPVESTLRFCQRCCLVKALRSRVDEGGGDCTP